MAAAWVDRSRLVDRAVDAPVVVLSAPGGWGKTTLVTQLLRRLGLPVVNVRLQGPTDEHGLLAALRRALVRAGIVDVAHVGGDDAYVALDAVLAALNTRPDGIAVFVDEAQHLTPGAARWARSFADDLGGRHRLAVAGRSIDQALVRRPGLGWARFGTDDLRFSVEEIASATGETVVERCEQILRDTDGWPVAVALTTRRDSNGTARESAGAVRGVGDGALLHVLLDEVLGDDLAWLAVLGHLPLLDATTADRAAGDGAWAALLGSGLPLRRAGDWWSLADPVREAMRRSAPEGLPPTVDPLGIAQCYDLPTGLAFLVGLGRHERVGALLAAAHWSELEQFAPRELAAAIDSLDPNTLDPVVLLDAGRAVEMRDPDLRRTYLARGLARAETGSSVAYELEAEHARDLVRSMVPEAEAAVARLLADVPMTEVRARARLLQSWGIVQAYRSVPEALAEAERAFTESAALMAMAGERRWQADVMNRLAYMVSYHSGKIALAAEQMAESLALLEPGSRGWALGLTYYSNILDTLGRSAEAEAVAREAYDYGVRVGDSLAVGFGAWSLAIVAAHRGDADATRRWLDEVERSPGGWAGEVSGQEFLAFGADLLGALGDRDGAMQYRARCAERVDATGTHELLDVIDGRLEAMYGDPMRAIELFERLDGSPHATIDAKWMRLLFRALAAARLGDRTGATAFIERSLHHVDQEGLPDLPFRMEPVVVSMLASVWPGGPGTEPNHAMITLLGAFHVARGSQLVTPAPGHPATLVKLVALRGKVTADQAVDALWPDADVSTGRSRLRNLLNRVRTQSGQVIIRDADMLMLDPSVDTDVARFEELVERTLSAPSEDRPGSARVALAAYGGDLLPGDLYEDWAAAPRERLRRRYLSLVDIVAEDAVARGDLDEAMRLFDLGIEREPLEEQRYVRAASAMIAAGRYAAARELVTRAMGVLGELGLKPGAALEAVGRSSDPP